MTLPLRHDQTGSPELEAVIVALQQCRYRTATERLSKFVKSTSSREDGEAWVIAFLCGHAGNLALTGREADRLLLEVHRKFQSPSPEMRIAKQLMVFYRSLYQDGERAALEEIINEIQYLNVQLNDKFSAGMLCARAALFEEIGNHSECIAALERAWGRSESIGGMCPASLVSAILRNVPLVGAGPEWLPWIDLLGELNTDAVCCRLRCSLAMLNSSGLQDRVIPATVIADLVEAIKYIECPSLVASIASAIFRHAANTPQFRQELRNDLASELETAVLRAELPPTFLFDVELSRYDVAVARDLDKLSGPQSSIISDPLRVSLLGDSAIVHHVQKLEKMRMLANSIDRRLQTSKRKDQINQRLTLLQG